MFFRIMDKADVHNLVRGLSTEYQVIGPVEKGDSFTLSVLDDPADLRLEYDTTILPPKKLFFPPCDELMRYRIQDNEVVSDEVLSTPRVIFGLHPCDINALMLMDSVFLGDEYPDPYYKARRESSLIVGVSCEPGDECFCGAWGTDEVNWGFDIFLSDLGDSYFVSVRSVKGADLLDRHVETTPVTNEDTRKHFRFRAGETVLTENEPERAVRG